MLSKHSFLMHRGDEWRQFTGNEIGALLGWWLLRSYREQNPGKSLEEVYMLSSTVSSKILHTMSKLEGFKFEVREDFQLESMNYICYCSDTQTKSLSFLSSLSLQETLTGFKWMGNRTCELMAEGKTVIFAFEEAIGFMCGSSVLDKDGVSAAVHVTEMAMYLKQNGKTLTDQLNELYNQYVYIQHKT